MIVTNFGVPQGTVLWLELIAYGDVCLIQATNGSKRKNEESYQQHKRILSIVNLRVKATSCQIIKIISIC